MDAQRTRRAVAGVRRLERQEFGSRHQLGEISGALLAVVRSEPAFERPVGYDVRARRHDRSTVFVDHAVAVVVVRVAGRVVRRWSTRNAAALDDAAHARGRTRARAGADAAADA